MSQSRVAQLAESVSDRDHTQGSADAPVTLVKYGDYGCSYRQEAFRAVKQLREDETVTEQTRFVFRSFPLTSVHPHAHRLPKPPKRPLRRDSLGRCTICCANTKRIGTG